MFKEIKSQFISGLDEQTWMDYSTRTQARLRLVTRRAHVTRFQTKLLDALWLKIFQLLNSQAFDCQSAALTR